MGAIPKKTQTKESKSKTDKSDKETDAKKKDFHTDTQTAKPEIKKTTDKQTDQIRKEVRAEKDNKSNELGREATLTKDETLDLKLEKAKNLQVNLSNVSKETKDSAKVDNEMKLKVERSREMDRGNDKKKVEEQEHREKEWKEVFGKKIFKIYWHGMLHDTSGFQTKIRWSVFYQVYFYTLAYQSTT